MVMVNPQRLKMNLIKICFEFLEIQLKISMNRNITKTRLSESKIFDIS